MAGWMDGWDATPTIKMQARVGPLAITGTANVHPGSGRGARAHCSRKLLVAMCVPCKGHTYICNRSKATAQCQLVTSPVAKAELGLGK
jgi:hypothetical protein